MADIFNLKCENIIGDYLYFHRKKTKRTLKTPDPVDLYITEPIRRILDKWGQKEGGDKDYLFDVYRKGMTVRDKKKAKSLATRRVNEALKRLRKRISLSQKVTTYVARHTWASTMMEHDAPLAYISKGLGHTSLATTERYLASFSNNKKVEKGNLMVDVSNKLINQRPSDENTLRKSALSRPEIG